MAIEIFNRYEKKYMIDKSVYEAIQIPYTQISQLPNIFTMM